MHLVIEANTPAGARKAAVPLDATVEQAIQALTDGVGHGYTFEVPLGEGEDTQYHAVPRDERLVDAMRGVGRRPQLVPNPSGGI